MLHLIIDPASGYGDLESAVVRAGDRDEARAVFVAKAAQENASPWAPGRADGLVIHEVVPDGFPAVLHTHVPT